MSLRVSRLEGDLEDDPIPEVGEAVHAYVVDTNKKGCFLRLSRHVEGRAILKELSDAFLPNPADSFPMGRIVVGKVKQVKPAKKDAQPFAQKVVDIDMRESVLMAPKAKQEWKDISVGSKYKGTVTRIEDFGVFVRIDNSNLSGLAHKSECSDKYIKNLKSLYDPGDLVKILVIKKDEEKKQLGFSMKASHFLEDQDSEEGSSVGESVEDEDQNDGSRENLKELDGLDSDDESFVAKLADRRETGESESERSASEDESMSSDGNDVQVEEASDAKIEKEASRHTMDTNVGFDWGGPSSRASNDNNKMDWEEEDGADGSQSDDDEVQKSSHRSRKKHSQRQREEQEIAQRESALADGTADENPETAADFERLLAGSPNSSELWIKVRFNCTRWAEGSMSEQIKLIFFLFAV